MTVIPIRQSAPAACFGVCCALHARCVLYAAVNGSQADPGTIGRCHDQAGVVTRFEQLPTPTVGADEAEAEALAA